MTELIRNRYYWARVRRLDGSPGGWEPVRYTGTSADTVVVEHSTKTRRQLIAISPETWDYIGQRSEDGHHFLEVVEVGAEIRRKAPSGPPTAAPTKKRRKSK